MARPPAELYELQQDKQILTDRPPPGLRVRQGGAGFSETRGQREPNWLEAGDYKQVSTKAEDYRDWWQAFNDPALNQLIDTAYRENLTLRIAGVRVLAARAQLGVAIGQLYPQTQQATGSLQKDAPQ